MYECRTFVSEYSQSVQTWGTFVQSQGSSVLQLQHSSHFYLSHSLTWAIFFSVPGSCFCFFSSVSQSCLTLCNPMDCSMTGFPVHHQLPEFTQTHIHWVSDAHPLSSPSLPTFNLSQHQGIFKWVSSSHQVAKVLEFQLQHQSFQWTPSTDFR